MSGIGTLGRGRSVDYRRVFVERSHLLTLIAIVFLTLFALPSRADQYESPYRLFFDIPRQELCGIDSEPPRDDWRLQSKTPFEEWYSRRTLTKFGAWGPDPRHFPAIPGLDRIPDNWKKQRVLTVASNLIGLPYQHHHIPAWNPPPSWPWKPVAYGCNSKGMDCSDFTAWVYNYGLGLHMSTGIGKQAETTLIEGPDGQPILEAQVIVNDNGYDDLTSKLDTGDLLYIKDRQGDKVSHVIMWVGSYGRSPDGTPLVIDCTGPDHKDCFGNPIPIGVQLRPFSRDSWYFKSFSHAHRIIGQTSR